MRIRDWSSDVCSSGRAEEPRLRCGIARETVIAVEMVGAEVGQHRDIARKAVREVDLVARQFEDIDPAFGQRLAAEDRQADIAPHQRRDPDRKSVVSGKSVSVRLEPGGLRILKKTKKQ